MHANSEDMAILAESGMAKMARGDLQGADDDLRAARRLTPNNLDLLAVHGALLQHRGHLHEAIALYRDVLAQDPDEIEIRCNLAKALADCGDETRALAEADQAVAQAEGQRGSLATRGAVLIDADNYAAARETLLKALDKEPTNDMALVNLALCCTELDELEAATNYLIRAVEMNPHNARAVADLINCLSALNEHEQALNLAAGFLGEHPGERLVVGAQALALLNAEDTEAARALTDCDDLVQVIDLPAPAAFDDADSFHVALAAEILNDPSLIDNPISKATTGGAQTGELDLRASAATQAFAELIDAALEQAIEQYRQRFATQESGLHPVMQPATPGWSLRAWGTVLRAGGRQAPHMHPLGWLSAVYYVALPEGIGADGESGYLEFGTPPPRMHCTEKPASRRIQPRAGRLVVFPSWFWHCTLPFAVTGAVSEPRISIAFDVMPQDMLRQL